MKLISKKAVLMTIALLLVLGLVRRRSWMSYGATAFGKAKPLFIAMFFACLLVVVQQAQGMKRPLEDAKKEDLTKKIRKLSLYDPQASADLLKAAEERNLKRCEDAIKRNADVNATDKDSWTPLFFACREGYTEIVTLLLAKGADVNATVPDGLYKGLTPFHLAWTNGHTEIVKLLLAVPNINVNAKDNDGRTPLHWECYNGRTETVKLLLAAPGINVNATDTYGKTPLHDACLKGRTDIVKLLVAHGATITPAIAEKYAKIIDQVPADIRLLGNLFTNPTPFAQSVEQKGLAAIDDMLVIAQKHDYKAIGRKLVELKINLQKAFGKGGLLERTPLPPELAKQIVAFFTDMNRKELVERKKPVKPEPKP